MSVSDTNTAGCWYTQFLCGVRGYYYSVFNAPVPIPLMDDNPPFKVLSGMTTDCWST